MFLDNCDEGKLKEISLSDFENEMIKSIHKKQDIYVTIAPEKVRCLFKLPRFICNWEYPAEERTQYHTDVGKLESVDCNFRFVIHNNVIVNPEKQPM